MFASVAVGYQWTLLACTLVPVVIEVARGLHTKAVAQPLGHHAHCSFVFSALQRRVFWAPFPVRSVSAHLSGTNMTVSMHCLIEQRVVVGYQCLGCCGLRS